MTRLLGSLIALLIVAACGAPQQTPAPSGVAGLISVVATTTVFADLVNQVGGDRVTVHSLVPQGGEVHTFDPSPSDAQIVAGAKLLVMNGLGLDDWVVDFAQSAGAGQVRIIKLGENLGTEVDYIIGGDEEDPDAINPHLWMNPLYAEVYADQIRLALIEADADGQETYDANMDAYGERLAELDEWAADVFSAIPAENRRIVAFHDAFPYFTEQYGLEEVGVIVDAPGQDPSAAEIAELVEAIRSAGGVKAILSETQFSDELARTVAAEAGATVVSDLYTDTLGDPPQDTYEGAFRYDVEQIAAALR